MSLEHIIQKLKGVRRGPNGYIAKCPAHEDSKQSLSIGESDGKVLLNCFAGCLPGRIVEAIGLEWKDLFDGAKRHQITSRSFQQPSQMAFHAPAKAKIAAAYRYTDADGNLLYENVRFEPKGFGQRHFDERGNPVWDLKGVTRVPYRLADLVNNGRHGSEVWLCEGEKDADTLTELGFTASSFKNWSRQFNKYIDKASVIICRDHDLPGGVQADEAARTLAGAARSVKVLDVHAEYEMPEKHGPDISDYVARCVRDEGKTKEEIAERLSLMADGCQRWFDRNTVDANLFVVKTGNQWLEDAKKRPAPKMLFGEFWFQGELCILFADTNVGKSILAVQMGDCISRGRSIASDSSSIASDFSRRLGEQNGPALAEQSRGGDSAKAGDSIPDSDLPLKREAIERREATEKREAIEKREALGRTSSLLTTEAPALKVVYFDFELTDKQFESRVARRDVMGDHYVDHYQFSPNFCRAEIDPETSELHGFKSFEEFLNHSLDKVIVEHNADVLIIDNLTYLRDETENARNALPLMKYLKEIKSRHGISILALAHTPKRDASKPLGRNDLQGSKMLINFCDSSFAIGESQKDPGVRYLKQLKARNSSIVYHGDNVLLGTIEKKGSLLQFAFSGTGSEREHLKASNDKEKAALMEQISELVEAGKSTREIAEVVEVSHSTVARHIKNMGLKP